MNSSNTTNMILVVIAFLLLVLVIQNGFHSQGTATVSYQNTDTTVAEEEHEHVQQSADAANPHTMNPTVKQGQTMMPQSMYFQAVKAFPKGCAGKNILAECDSADAQAIKAQIQKVADTGKRPREVFDYIVQTWGENALTPEAQQIRAARVQSK